jgi:Rrf2 family iron-sulfur cluster assembly transcriptional regulator
MRMSTRGRFAVSAMIDLALHAQQGPVSLAAIGARQHVSLSYLEQLFSRLRRRELVQSTRGPGGGYTLGREAESISVADIMLAVDDPDDERFDGLAPAQGRIELDLWQRVGDKLVEYLRTVSLHSLVEEQRALGVQIENRPARRAAPSARSWKPLRTRAPNSVFAFGRSFAADA